MDDDLAINATFRYALDDDEWYRDRTRVRAIVDAVLDAPLGRTLRRAGTIDAPKKFTSRAAAH